MLADSNSCMRFPLSQSRSNRIFRYSGEPHPTLSSPILSKMNDLLTECISFKNSIQHAKTAIQTEFTQNRFRIQTFSKQNEGFVSQIFKCNEQYQEGKKNITVSLANLKTEPHSQKIVKSVINSDRKPLYITFDDFNNPRTAELLATNKRNFGMKFSAKLRMVQKPNRRLKKADIPYQLQPRAEGQLPSHCQKAYSSQEHSFSAIKLLKSKSTYVKYLENSLSSKPLK